MDRSDLILDYCRKNGITCKTGVPMSGLTTFRIGGPAHVVVSPGTIDSLAAVIALCGQAQLPWFVLGNGSNLLVRDEGLEQVVLHLSMPFSRVWLEGEDTICCEAGASLAAVCRFAAEHGLTGLEFAYGIPGSMGGALYMNAGAYGGELAQVVVDAQHLDESGTSHTLLASEMALGYRTSIYQSHHWCIAGLRLRLGHGDPQQIRAQMQDILQRRREKQPLEWPSAGSTFKRPQGAFAGALIEQCGLKGARVGGAQVSEKHAGFLINAGGATCEDMLQLIRLVQRTVYEQTGHHLECEVKTV